MIRIETSTEIFPILYCGLYGTELGSYYEECSEEYLQDFKDYLVSVAKDKIEEMIKECETGIEVKDFSFSSPQWYNYSNDTVEFTLEIPNLMELKAVTWVEEIKEDKSFIREIKELFGSHSGFVSFAPADSWKELHEAIMNNATKDKFERALQIYLYYQLKDNCDLEEYQNDFEEEIIEHGNQNGWFDRKEWN